MKKVEITNYKCEKCGTIYSTIEQATECEKKPITEDKGVKVGDAVIILNGDGAGEKAIVENISVFSMNWGHYSWKRYWHTVGISAKLINSYGSRLLTFDDYEPVK